MSKIHRHSSIDNIHKNLEQQMIIQQSEPYKISNQIQERIWEHLQFAYQYKVHNITIEDKQGKKETLHTVYVQSKIKTDINLYLGHGFGGTSFMYFIDFQNLLSKANLVLWETRGMGLNQKPTSYPIPQLGITDFFVKGLQKIIEYYNHKNIVLMSHSFSAYITLRYILSLIDSDPQQKLPHIKKLLLLSPIGITPKAQDYKNQIHSCSDIWNTLFSKFAWKFNLTYKSVLRKICDCLQIKALKNSFRSSYKLTQEQLDLLVSLFITLSKLKDGSQNLFFEDFKPRVLPKQGNSIVEIIKGNTFPIQTKLYFGDKDWADQSGSQLLTKKFNNISCQILKDCDHMIPLSKIRIQQISNKELI